VEPGIDRRRPVRFDRRVGVVITGCVRAIGTNPTQTRDGRAGIVDREGGGQFTPPNEWVGVRGLGLGGDGRIGTG
jgi:hypothetical protein